MRAKLVSTNSGDDEAAHRAQLCYTVDQAAAAIGVSRATVYELFRRGDLAPRRIIGRTVIDGDELRRFVANLPAAPVRVKPRAAEQAAA